jgi:DNA-binding response OmpR family regulator
MPVHAAVNVLLIENDSFLRNTIASMLGMHGHTVFHAFDENQASALIKSAPYNVLIYSFNPGRMPLSEVVLNAKNIQPHIKVIVANECDATVKFSLNEAIDAYLKKPFTVNELQAVIQVLTQPVAGPAPAE